MTYWTKETKHLNGSGNKTTHKTKKILSGSYTEVNPTLNFQ